jgi:undecaprenyl-diphosphatase
MRRLAPAFPALGRLDLSVCRFANRIHRRVALAVFFRAVSRLGDGWAWLALAPALWLAHGAVAGRTIGRMAAMAALGLLLYRWIKRSTGRPRPYQTHPSIVRVAAALDRYSFPSGHTLHAVCFTTIVVGEFPDPWALLLIPFSFLVAVSRVTLGLHYPSDVLAGGALGFGLGALALRFLV